MRFESLRPYKDSILLSSSELVVSEWVKSVWVRLMHLFLSFLSSEFVLLCGESGIESPSPHIQSSWCATLFSSLLLNLFS
jgi:hypothetical protein